MLLGELPELEETQSGKDLIRITIKQEEGAEKHLYFEALKSEAAKRYNNSRLENWWNPRPPFADQPALEWTNTGIDEATSRTSKMLESIRPDAWADVHAYVMQLISEAP